MCKGKKNKLNLRYEARFMERKIYAVILAAGSGRRMGSELPKQFLELEGKAILQRTIEQFVKAVPEARIVTVLPEESIGYWKEYCRSRNFLCPQILVKGGISRFHSVRNALEKIPDGAIVAVHDGVRPLFTPDLIRRMLEKMETSRSAIPVTPMVDTLKVLRKTTDGGLESIPGMKVDRSVTFGAQTPQMFFSEDIKDAYRQAYDLSFTDDASVLENKGYALEYVEGERFNLKITTPDDLQIASAILKIRGEF